MEFHPNKIGYLPFATDPKVSPDTLRLGRQASTLIIVEPKAPVAQLLSEYSVFLPHVIDRVALLLTQPSGNRYHQQAERIEGLTHCDSIPPSVL